MSIKTIALIGNPNAGKTTLFNQLSGLHQKTGNYPGITVEKKEGKLTYKDTDYRLIDLPGVYSLCPSSADEEVVLSILANPDNPYYPDIIIVVADVHNMKRSLFLYEQIKDLKIPTILVINQIDNIEKEGILIRDKNLADYFSTPVVLVSSRKGKGIDELKEIIYNGFVNESFETFQYPKEFEKPVRELSNKFEIDDYLAWLFLAQTKTNNIPSAYRENVSEIINKYKLIPKRLQLKETILRHRQIDDLVEKVVYKDPNYQTFTNKFDKIATHHFWGYFLFFSILFLIFQALFFLSGYPQDWIETLFANTSELLEAYLPNGPLSELITQGIIPGISGVAVFVPQIAILFFFLLIMEESGYMARVVFLMDRWFRPVGLNGKSVVPLLSGAACAIPAIMSARNIENSKERLITILVTPFITCSARLPVYSIIIALVIPKGNGIFNLQGIVMMIMYLLGVIMVFISASIANKLIKSNYKSYLILDMPNYKVPFWRNVFYGLFEKSLSFIANAGKIIVAVSVILWALGKFGKINENGKTNYLADVPLENSYLGNFGKVIEPVFKPLGYDWKIDIGILSSFAAREVFVGTIASIYSLEDDGSENLKLKELMRKDINHNTMKPTFNLATGISILLFYAFAMQCVSTLAVVRKETNSWRWPAIQLFFMTGIAYLVALLAYQLLK
ncbi:MULTISPECIES: ferrous iron transport protein B [unclassified Apibacter]|uniref:ferrous iron transport protein B n=1 Tax=unclassified Apibacter TaxID=2630820 RepID=UPI00132BFCFF|nr:MULTISPECIES: ferrous iron transport protein B [unclassified Apibacter]MCX8677891.1 ferrous iron transport protein B [Apibacter sp. B3919]MXO25156.1 ferrous iron transport protein B [Apibacter sp. B3924]MXO27359.1 ferrous iron transport protein B [Apibacter sp. B3813]MXO29172.1 ferrous iron transport protein B [Apibacter sp. B3913]MXO31325.1 ferrous iron transport protein B [Apibacter sp. B3912]